MPSSTFWLSYVLVHLLATALAAGLAGYVHRVAWRKPIGKVFAAMAVSFAVWTFFSLARTFVADPAGYVLLTSLKYVGVTTAPVTVFLFGLIYADGEQYVTRRSVAALLVVPALTLVALATTLRFGLFYAAFEPTSLAGRTVLETARGAWFWGFAVYGWGLLALGSFLLVYGGYRLPWLYRTHVVLVVLGISVPWSASIAYVVYGWPHPAVDPTPIGFAVASLLWAVGVFGTDLVDVSPVARSRVVSTIGDPVVVVDNEKRVVDRNAAAEPLLEDPDPFGEAAADVLSAKLAARVDSGTQAPDRAASGQELLAVDVDGETRHYQCDVLPLGPDADLGSVVILSDVTELTAVKRELETRNVELERQNDRLDEFASMVSHDLRNPLTVAKGNLELLDEEVDSELVDHVDESLSQMERLVDDLLTLARQGQTVGDTDTVDLADLVDEAWRSVPTGAASLEIDDDDLGTVEADRDRLLEALQNLFRNAVEHGSTSPRSPTPGNAVEHGSTSPRSQAREDAVEHGSTSPASRAQEDAEEPVRESLTVRVGSTEGGLYVADDGPGIPAEERDRVFDHGYSTNDGTGFGLTIVETIVEAHGWSIRATESAAGGARFEIETASATCGLARDSDATELEG